jgi:hypothetical protein
MQQVLKEASLKTDKIMAKFTPGLMGAKTTPTLEKDMFGGYIDKGMNQLQSALSQSLAQNKSNKAQRFQQAASLRDGIVSGHFSDDMVTQVEASIERLAKLNPNGSNYSKVLNQSNAELGMTVAKQNQVTKLLERTSAAFEGDEDKKYYDKEGFFALLEDNTNLELTSQDMQGAYKSYLKGVDNINQDVVREDFVELLGKYKFGGSTKSGEGKIGEFSTLKQGEYSGEKTQMYKLKNGRSVPVFTDSKDVPTDLVEKWGTSSKAHMAMLDAYVDKKTEGQSGTPEEMEALEMAAGQEFVLEQMKQVIPDYASVSKTRESFQPGQGSGSGNNNNTPNPSSLVATQLSRALLGDQSIIGNSPMSELVVGNETIDGFDVTNQFKDIKLIPGIGKSPGRPAAKIFRPANEDVLYIDTGRGVVKYDESQFNDLMIMASSAGNGFTMKDANSLPEYDNTSKAFNIRQTVTDGTTTKNISELTPAEAQSGKWSPANQSLAGTKYQKYSMSDDNKSKVLFHQQAAGNALAAIDGFSYDLMDDSSTNYDLNKEMAKAINSAWAGNLVTSLDATRVIRKVERAGMSANPDRGRDKYLVTFEDGSEKYVTQSAMKFALQETQF